VFVNEDCFIHDPANIQQIKQIINQHPSTVFIVFMAIANVHFHEYLLVRKNMRELKRDPRKLKWTNKYVKGGIRVKK